MRIFRYIMFLSILSCIFFVIYRQSDQKGFRRWSISFKVAVLFAAIAAGLIPLNTEAIESPGNNNQVYQERLLSDQKVILVKTGGNSPSVPTSLGKGQPINFPTPPAGGRPSRPRTTPHVNPYRVPPRLVDPGLGGAAGGGGAAEFEFKDQCSVSENKKSQESKFDYDYRSNDPKKKKKSAKQCELDENIKDVKVDIVYRIKENTALVREAERAGRDQDAQRSINNLVEQLSLGNRNPGIGTENVFKDIYELRGKNRARVYYREVDGKIEILGKSVKSNQQKVINILKKMYD